MAAGAEREDVLLTSLAVRIIKKNEFFL